MKKINLFVATLLLSNGIFGQNEGDTLSVDVSTVEVVKQATTLASESLRIVTVLSKDDIATMPVQSVNDLLDYLPGVDVRTRGANGVLADLSMRGGTFDQVIVLLNGVNVTDPQTGHQNLDIPIDISVVDRIEILQGTSMNVFGLSAFSGAINIITGTRAENSVDVGLVGGSDGYLAFLDNLLGIRETANIDLVDIDYDVRVFDSPTKMRQELEKLNSINNKSRIVAGYCYEWISEHAQQAYDIYLEDGFKAQWNLRGGQPFAIADTSFDQVGCIHTCQGLEFDYVGVIIGLDMRYENGKVITDQTKIAKSDKTSGIKTCKNKELADRLIRNTYKTLMSRGQKGCFIYCEDESLREYLKQQIKK